MRFCRVGPRGGNCSPTSSGTAMAEGMSTGETWNAHHDELPIKAADLALPVRALIDPQGRGRQYEIVTSARDQLAA